jgi:protein O-GlcNAcase/histone acetyltransferase
MSVSENKYGVIEGFYGRPWSQSERRQLFQWMGEWGGLNTYMYAPKDDLYHRSKWRDLYPESYQKQLRELVDLCSAKNVTFIYGIAPGLDMEYASKSEFGALTNKISQLIAMGCSHFALLFDDIPEELPGSAAKKYSSFAQAHCDLANRLLSFLNEHVNSSRLFFCPTPYCARLTGMDVPGNGYLNEVGQLLHQDIDVFWTGPEVVSESISVESIRELATVIKRKPVIWDNLHANDYDMLRFFTGPFQGRAPELKNEVKGILSNPNTPFWPNFIPLRSLSDYVQDGAGNARQSFECAVREFAAVYSIPDDLIEAFTLLCDCFYLPFEFGETAQRFLDDLRHMLEFEPNEWDGRFERFESVHQSIQQVLITMNAIEDRERLYSIYHSLWDFREMLFLLEGVLGNKRKNEREPFKSPYHFQSLFQGGFSDLLKPYLHVQKDGTILIENK